MLRRIVLHSRSHIKHFQLIHLLKCTQLYQAAKYNSTLSPNLSLILQRKMANAAVSGFNLTEIDGDLFSAPESFSLAHCVAADLGMGAGVAVRFKQLFGRVEELRRQGVETGGVATLKDKERYIYYLITKKASMGRPTYDSLHSSLCSMRDHMQSNNVQKLAIPRIGCGIDGLEWEKVSAQLKDVFKNENLEIVVYNYVPK